MKKVLLSTVLAGSLLTPLAMNADINITHDNNKIYFDGSSEKGTLQNMFIYKNGTYIKATKNKYLELPSETNKYKVIMVINENGKTKYVQKEINIIKENTKQNIDPTLTFDFTTAGTKSKFSLSGSDSDGKIVESGIFLYDKNGKFIAKVQDGSTYDFKTIGQYQAIAYVIDNNGQKVMKSVTFEVKETGPDYSTGKVSTVDASKIYDKEYTGYYMNGKTGFLPFIGAGAAYAQGWTGAGVKVGILDSGIDFNSTQLKNNIISVYSVRNYSDVAISGYDDYRHGTGIAGIIAASKDGVGIQGVAYEADLISVKVLDNYGKGTPVTVADGLRIATSQGAKVTNISIGGYLPWDTANFIDAYKTAINSDNSLIIAAGNDSKQCTNTNGVLSGCSYPAAYGLMFPELTKGTGAMIVVGAVNKSNQLANYSNTAGAMKDYFMVAYGGSGFDIVETIKPGDVPYYTMGTSIATPMVTGAFALLAQKYPFLKGNQIKDILFASATDLGAVGVDDVFGHGALNIAKAMQPIGTLNIPTKNGNSLATSSIISSTGLLSATSIETVIVDDFGRAFQYNISNIDSEKDPFENFNFEDLTDMRYKNIVISVNEEKQHFALGYVFGDFQVQFSTEGKVFGSEGYGATEFNGETYYAKAKYNFEDILSSGVNFSTSLSVGYSKPEVGGLFNKSTSVVGVGTDNYIYNKYNNIEFKLGVKTPMTIVHGEFNADIPVSQDSNGDIVYENKNIDITSDKIDYKVYASVEMKF